MAGRGRDLSASLIMIVALWAMWALSLPGLAQEQDQGVRVTVLLNDPEAEERSGLEGIRLEVTDAAEGVVGEGVTGPEGTADIPLPMGIYTVNIDPATVPDGVNFANPDQLAREVNVQAGRFTPAIFQLTVGESGGPTEARGITMGRVLQLTVNGFKIGIFLAMTAIGLSLVYGTTGLVNFAHAEMVTWGMLVAYFFNVLGLVGMFGFMDGWPWIFGGPVDLFTSAILAMVAGALAGWALDSGIFAKLRRRGTGLIAQMVVTIGMGIFFRYVFLYFFGGASRFFRSYAAQEAIAIGPIFLTPKDIISMGFAILVLVAVGLTLQFTRAGRAMRAVADNRDLAESSGIDVQRVIRWVWMSGGALAALGGVMVGLSDVIRWDAGYNLLLLIFAGVTLGGLGTAYGALVGCILVGIGIQWSTMFMASELRNIGALVLMTVVLLIRPQGIMGRKERIG